jgi:hypothetical protein
MENLSLSSCTTAKIEGYRNVEPQWDVRFSTQPTPVWFSQKKEKSISYPFNYKKTALELQVADMNPTSGGCVGHRQIALVRMRWRGFACVGDAVLFDFRKKTTRDADFALKMIRRREEESFFNLLEVPLGR